MSKAGNKLGDVIYSHDLYGLHKVLKAQSTDGHDLRRVNDILDPPNSRAKRPRTQLLLSLIFSPVASVC